MVAWSNNTEKRVHLSEQFQGPENFLITRNVKRKNCFQSGVDLNQTLKKQQTSIPVNQIGFQPASAATSQQEIPA